MHVLEPFAPVALGMLLYYPDRRQMTPKLRAFIDHAKMRPEAANKEKNAVRQALG